MKCGGRRLILGERLTVSGNRSIGPTNCNCDEFTAFPNEDMFALQ